MTHDYAKKPAPKKRKKKNQVVKKKSTQVPGWVWLFTGIVTGLFIAFLGYLADVNPESAPEPLENASATAPAKPKPKFEFYTLLPEQEVIVPMETDNMAAEQPREKVLYILQTGSFRNAADADRQRASLILLGLEAKVDKVKTDNGDTWHRVQVGPYSSRSKLQKTRGILVSKGINPLTLEKKSS